MTSASGGKRLPVGKLILMELAIIIALLAVIAIVLITFNVPIG